MKPIDLYNHVIPRTIIDEVRARPELYKQFDALTHHPQATRHLLDMVGSERVVLGTDSPYDMGEERPIQELDAVPGLTPAERDDVCYRSAMRLFGGAL